MNFMEYSNKNHINIIPQEAFEGLIHEVFDLISSNICKSLGPLGSSATILDGMLTEATKDGFTILKNYRFHNRYKRMVYNLIKTPCIRMNNTVGDGTTTAIALANFLFTGYEENKYLLDRYFRLPRTFTKAWDKIIEELISKIREAARPINPEDYDTIFNLAYVTSNGNEEISKAIAETYVSATSPNIKQKDSPTNKSYISPISGFDFPAHLIDEGYVRNEDLSVEEKDICVMVFDHKIESDPFTKFIVPINEILRAQNKKLLVLAPFYDAYLCDTLLEQYMNAEYRQFGKLNLILGQYEIGKLDPHQLNDLATILRAKVVTLDLAQSLMEVFSAGSIDRHVEQMMGDETFEFHRLIGTASKALLSCTNGSIFQVENIETDERYCDVLRRAYKELEDIKNQTDHERQSYSSKIYEANTRVLQLEMRNYIYYIGADSELQKKIIWDAVDDVIKCIRSAIKFGMVPGCQLAIINGCTQLLNESGINDQTPEEFFKALSDETKLRVTILYIIQTATLNVYSSILHGSDRRGMVKLIPLWEFITNQEGAEALGKEAQKKGKEIIQESISRGQVFDLESLEYSDRIITSAETDVMVLTAASELVKILISGNQCIFLDSDVNESHNEDREVYV